MTFSSVVLVNTIKLLHLIFGNIDQNAYRSKWCFSTYLQISLQHTTDYGLILSKIVYCIQNQGSLRFLDFFYSKIKQNLSRSQTLVTKIFRSKTFTQVFTMAEKWFESLPIFWLHRRNSVKSCGGILILNVFVIWVCERDGLLCTIKIEKILKNENNLVFF